MSTNDSDILEKLSAYITFCDAPYKIDLELLGELLNYFRNYFDKSYLNKVHLTNYINIFLANPFSSNSATKDIQITTLYTMYKALKAQMNCS